MLFVLMPETELEEILTDLGYEIPDMSQMIAKNIQYYETRTRYIFPSFSLFSIVSLHFISLHSMHFLYIHFIFCVLFYSLHLELLTLH